eukprot:scaffold255068_cov41-Tisochrysis_lutea.AAC.1
MDGARRKTAKRGGRSRAFRYSCDSSSTRLSSASHPLSTPTTCEAAAASHTMRCQPARGDC